MPAASTVTVASTCVFARIAPTELMALVRVKVPEMPSLPIALLPAPSALSCEVVMFVATAVAPVALVSRLAMTVFVGVPAMSTSDESRSRLVMLSTRAMLALTTALLVVPNVSASTATVESAGASSTEHLARKAPRFSEARAAETLTVPRIPLAAMPAVPAATALIWSPAAPV